MVRTHPQNTHSFTQAHTFVHSHKHMLEFTPFFHMLYCNLTIHHLLPSWFFIAARPLEHSAIQLDSVPTALFHSHLSTQNHPSFIIITHSLSHVHLFIHSFIHPHPSFFPHGHSGLGSIRFQCGLGGSILAGSWLKCDSSECGLEPAHPV